MSGKSVNDSGNEMPNPSRSGTGTGPSLPAAEEKNGMHRKNPVPCYAQRATALRGQGIGRPPAPKSAVRRQTYGDIYGKDPEIPYVKFEAGFRDLVCSLMERQDRMNEEIFYRINDLASRLDDLEDCQENGGGG